MRNGVARIAWSGYTPGMPTTDRYGLEITTSSARAAKHFQDGMDRLLSYSAGAEDAFSAALDADPGLAVAHTGLALLALVQGDAATARAAVGRARETVVGATRRERQHVEALRALISGETARGLALVDEHVAEFPRDAIAVHQAGNAIALAGGSDREAYRVAFMERLAPAYGDDWWYQVALGFAYHEVDRFEESRRLSERSLQQYPSNANAVHNLAHISFETLDTEAGAALLWRFRLDGKPERTLPWRSLADLAERVSRPGFLFGEAHAALAYAACGDEAALTRLIDGLRALDARGHPIAGCVALPLVQGTVAFAAGDHAGALAHFEPVLDEMHRIGGSHAQWELYEETMVVSYPALERYDDALRLLRRRLGRRASPRDLGWLEQVTAGLSVRSMGAR